VDERPTFYVMVGLPGAGKTTRARQLEVEHRALLLSLDEWMIPLYGAPDVGGKQDVLEGRLISLALSALRIGVSVVLDFGVWSRDERSALRWLAGEVGATCELIYLAIDPDEQRRRIAARFRRQPGSTYEMKYFDLAKFRDQFEVPAEDELATERIDAPPMGHGSWESWASERWPSFVLERAPGSPE
jgi:predicted kinase